MDARRVLDILALLDAHSIPVWLDGGWAIDALLAQQTRPHDDLDLVCRLEDTERIQNALRSRDYSFTAGAPPLSFEVVDRVGHQVDVHPARFLPTGDATYRMANGEDWIYPAHGFDGVGSILGRDVPCLTPDVVMLNHTTGYALDDDHQRDVRALGERYGIDVPAFRRA
jgi:lincosamide nucleotidyltransferase A/C/D/E